MSNSQFKKFKANRNNPRFLEKIATLAEGSTRWVFESNDNNASKCELFLTEAFANAWRDNHNGFVQEVKLIK